MAAVQTTHVGIAFGASWRSGNFVEKAADQMAERVTAKRVTGQQDNIEREYNRSDADAEALCAGCTREPHRFPRVVRENENEEQREVQEIAMNVLHDERKGIFA